MMTPAVEEILRTRGLSKRIVTESQRTSRPLSKQAVSAWRGYKNGVPFDRVDLVAKATGWPKYKIRPDIYPPPKKKKANGRT